MSLHDAVIILKLTNDMEYEYRVEYILNVQAIEPTFTCVKNAFLKSYSSNNLSEAIKVAAKIDKDKETKYGQLILSKYKDYEWDDILVGASREGKKFSKRDN